MTERIVMVKQPSLDKLDRKDLSDETALLSTGTSPAYKDQGENM